MTLDSSKRPCFNPRTRVGCDAIGVPFLSHLKSFNPRTRVGCDVAAERPRCFRAGVSIHAPAWGATCKCRCSQSGKLCFNPRTRVGCDLLQSFFHRHLASVSIHAPAWGATPLPRPSACKAKSFNPRTRVGCDGEQPLTMTKTNGFQSTHPRGVRQLEGADKFNASLVSIHAPAWGATRGQGIGAARCTGFNPRTRVGCDQAIEHKFDDELTFQSTHPRGVRREQHIGCCAQQHVSIHAPAWGATTAPKDHDVPLLVSIHAPAWGATTAACTL